MVNPNEYYATGKRKEAIARVYLRPGTGTMMVNGRPFDEYFPTTSLRTVVKQPLVLTETGDKFDAHINVGGGGSPGRPGPSAMGCRRPSCSGIRSFGRDCGQRVC
jgi:small subunit ribosomal protein S9